MDVLTESSAKTDFETSPKPLATGEYNDQDHTRVNPLVIFLGALFVQKHARANLLVFAFERAA